MAWAVKQDLVNRYGGEFVDKLARRRDYDETAKMYVEDNSEIRINQVVDLALDDAKNWMLAKLSCCYPLKVFTDMIVEGKVFPYLKSIHIKMTISILKDGGDCKECQECQTEFAKFCECNQLCTEDGICIGRNRKSKFAVEKTDPSCWPKFLCCNSGSCSCAKI